MNLIEFGDCRETMKRWAAQGTKANEYIFLLSKSERYYFDHEAIKEPAKVSSEGIRFSF